MNHVCAVVNEKTGRIDIVLLYRHAPIGPRLETNVKMPDIPSTGYGGVTTALEAAQIFDDWLEQQANPTVAKPKPPVVEIKPDAVFVPKLPPVVHAPAPKIQRDLFDDL